MFFLSDTQGALETVTLPLSSTIDDGAIFTINTANSSNHASTLTNLTSRVLFNLHSTDRSANETSDTFAIWYSGHANYQTTSTERSASDAYTVKLISGEMALQFI